MKASLSLGLFSVAKWYSHLDSMNGNRWREREREVREKKERRGLATGRVDPIHGVHARSDAVSLTFILCAYAAMRTPSSARQRDRLPPHTK
jgi:hypothetical protein